MVPSTEVEVTTTFEEKCHKYSEQHHNRIKCIRFLLHIEGDNIYRKRQTNGHNISRTSQNIVIQKNVHRDTDDTGRNCYRSVPVGYTLIVVLETFGIEVNRRPIDSIVKHRVEAGVYIVPEKEHSYSVYREEP